MPPVFAKQTDIPKGFEEDYEEADDGQWHPIDRTSKIAAALASERTAREKAEATANKAAREAAAAEARAKATASGMTAEAQKELYDKIDANVRAEVETKYADYETVKKENRDFKLKNVVVEMFRVAGANPKRNEDFWKLYSDEFDLTSDGKPMVKSEPGKDVLKQVQAITKARPEWMMGTKASGGGAGGSQSTTQPNGSTIGGVTFDELLKNPGAAIAQANA